MEIRLNDYRTIKNRLLKSSKLDNYIKNITTNNSRVNSKYPIKLLKLKINNKKEVSSNLKLYSLFPKVTTINLTPITKRVKTLQNKKKKLKIFKRHNKAKRNLLSFDPCLKMLNDNLDANPYNRKLIEQRTKKKNELYFDYDKKNEEFKFNSFSGNDPSLLKSKVLFVKGVYDYIYPRLVIKRMKFLESENRKEIKEKVEKYKKEFNNNQIFVKRFRTPEEISIMSKYELGGATSNEAIKTKGNVIKLKKIFINGQLFSKFTNFYDYKE